MTDLVDPFEVASSSGSAGSAGPSGSYLGVGTEPAETGGDLLDEVRAWLARHIVVMRDGDLDVLTVWAAHTHLATRLYTSPRLQIDSPVPESGKTTVLEHLERLAFRPLQASSLSSPALLARVIGDSPRTILLDEVDRTLDPKKDGVGEIVAILNSGYKVGGTRPTLVPVKGGGWEAEEFSTFAPVVLAGNQPQLPDDTRTRIIRVLLLPDWRGTAEESDWELKDAEARELGERLALWATAVDVTARPALPAGVTGRFREKWLPLARVAMAASPQWLDRILALAAEDVDEVRRDREEGLAVEKPAVLLLRHIVQLWPEGEQFWPTTRLVSELVAAHPDVWGAASSYGRDLTAQRLGRMLSSSYGIRSTREDSTVKDSTRGYRRTQFGTATKALTARSAGATPTPESEPEEPEIPAEPAEFVPRTSCTACGGPMTYDDGTGTHPACTPHDERTTT
jgi:hypothetical protein